MPTAKEILVGASCLTLYVIWIRVYRIISSPLRHLVGPQKGGFLLGNLAAMADARKTISWFSDFGPTVRVDGPLRSDFIITRDLKAISHVMNHGDTYVKASAPAFIVRGLVGEGVLIAEHGQHKRQRRVLNPAFGTAQIRDLTEIFNSESQRFRDRLSSMCSNGPVNISRALGECTMQIIGLAGFDYDFSQQSEEFSRLFARLFQGSEASKFRFTFLQGLFPILRPIPTEQGANVKLARSEMNKVGKALVDRVRSELQANGGMVEKKDFNRKDILSLLVRANMASDLPENQRLSDKEMIDQIPTFLVAGSETTSTAVTWSLFELCKHPEIQSKLRNELLTMNTDNPTMEELNSLPYLDSFIREILRVWPPVTQIFRQAVKDDVIPLSQPVVDQAGGTQEYIQLRKGQQIYLHVLGVNQSTEIWGDDAEEFKPERWERAVPEGAQAIPGMWGNILSFYGGPRGCIGFRFAIVEAKALLYTLLRAFTFELAEPIEKMTVSKTLVTRPVVIGDKDGQNKLPVLIKPYVSGN